MQLPFEVDTGAAVSLISLDTKQKFFKAVKLKDTSVALCTYTVESIRVLGTIQVQVKYGDTQVVCHKRSWVNSNGPGLAPTHPSQLKEPWNWQNPRWVIVILRDNQELFEEGQGTIRDYKAKLSVVENAKLHFCRPRPVPFALKEPIEKELHRLEEAKVIENIPFSEWAAPIVVVPKADGKVRICGDYKVTGNPVLDVDSHPLPKPQELLATLSGGKKFTR